MALENTVIQDKLTAAFGAMCHFKQEKDIRLKYLLTNYSDCSLLK
jgi:hypothetical protein